GAESGDDTGSDEADIFEDTAESHRHGDRNTFPVGQPAVSGAGIQSNRSARAKGAIDHQEQSKRRSTRCADTGTAGANRSRAVGAGTASQCESANSSDGDSGRSEEHTSELQSHLNLVC